MNDVIIVGGGPAGLYAGAKLARSGASVTLFEEHAGVGEPVHCTGVLAREAFDEFALPSDAVLNDLTTVRFHAPTAGTIDYSTAKVEAVVIDRRRFDRTLAALAAAAGVRVRCGDRVSRVDVDADGVTVRAGATVARARACVLACGASYKIQRRLGLGIPRLLLHTAQAELPASRLGDVEVHFGERVAPHGFAWAVPVDRAGEPFVRVGVMCDRGAGEYFDRILGDVSSRWGVRAGTCRPRQKILPLGPIDRTYTDRVVVLGDAAGLVKPTTGGGIYYSLVSAAAAADVLAGALAAGDLRASALAPYETQWRKRLGPELRWQLVLRRIADRLTDEDIDGLFDLAHTDGIMPLVRKTAAFNHHREFIMALLKHPPARRVLYRAVLA